MIIYAVISRSSDAAVLVESSTAGLEGNHPQITSELLCSLQKTPDLVPMGNRKTFVHRSDVEKRGSSILGGDFQSFWGGVDTMFGGAEKQSEKKSVTFDDHYFHVMHGEGAYYVCLSNDVVGSEHNVNFCFLHDVQEEFSKRYSPNKISKVNAYGMEKAFSSNLAALMHHYNTNRNSLKDSDKVAALIAEIDTLKSAMGTNITLSLTRGENLEKIVDKSEDLLDESKVFRKRSRTLKQSIVNRNLIYQLVLGGFVILMVYFIAANACGMALNECND